jgi:hypothetical protein
LVDLPKYVQLANLGFFGNGEKKYMLLPIVPLGFSVIWGFLGAARHVSCEIFLSRALISKCSGRGTEHLDPAAGGADLVWWPIFGICTFALEAVVNLRFGYSYCKRKQLEIFVEWMTSNCSAEDAAKLLTNLGRSVVLVVLPTALISGCYLVADNADNLPDTLNKHFSSPFLDVWEIIAVIGMVLVWGTLFYLCALWCWLNIGVYHVAKSIVAQRITPESVRTGIAGDTIQELLQEMRLLSSHWKVNHAVRLITTTITATDFLVLFVIESQYLFLVQSVLLYSTVWVSAIVSGYVSDEFFCLVLEKLACVANDEGAKCRSESLTGHSDNCPSHCEHFATVQQATMLMQRVEILSSHSGGLSFAGIPNDNTQVNWGQCSAILWSTLLASIHPRL